MAIETEYKGIKITFENYSELWKSVDDGVIGEYRNASLAKVKKWIDKKRKGKFTRTKITYAPTYNYPVAAMLTSVTEEGHCWVTYQTAQGEKREKVKIDTVFEYDEAIITRIADLVIALRKAEDKIHGKIKQIKATLKPFPVNGM